ncbi:MAG: helix-hairpin-helix domain-containing protein [Gemmatirosa sp.]|nr:helix-hairpin-helix domain-containing protein [Gemmatirosa sp.]
MDVMDLEQKLAVLMSLAADDREGMPGRERVMAPLPPRLRNAGRQGALGPLNLRNVRVPGRGRATLLRVLMTNACSYNCHYCPMRRDRDMPRTLLTPEELVRIFLGARERGWCDGLFVTTGIPGRPVAVMDRIIQVLELLRFRHGFTGYVHVKIVPGADPAQIERVVELANRVSVNLEAPCGATLPTIAPEKRFEVADGALARAQSLVRLERAERRDGKPADVARPGGVAGMTVQFVVGATSDSDRTFVGKVAALHAAGGLHHAHFSAFRPIRDTPMESVAATPALREHRLYQTDYLLRDYGFGFDEIPFDAAGNLSLAVDPKAAAALAQPDRFPVEVRTAPYELLLRVPGIGPASARRIVAERAATTIRSLADLRGLGVVASRAAGFLTIGGRRVQDVRWAEQLPLWAADPDLGRRARVHEFSPGTFR